MDRPFSTKHKLLYELSGSATLNQVNYLALYSFLGLLLPPSLSSPSSSELAFLFTLLPGNPLFKAWLSDFSLFFLLTSFETSFAFRVASSTRAFCASGDSPRIEPKMPLRGFVPFSEPVPI